MLSKDHEHPHTPEHSDYYVNTLSPAVVSLICIKSLNSLSHALDFPGILFKKPISAAGSFRNAAGTSGLSQTKRRCKSTEGNKATDCLKCQDTLLD